ncbi:hypothetical protein [Cohnella nanjingensis]|uniref:Adhesin n=1 Tax=Cohnella nanjingensis TaxID=1387779 RepID=A0A7X0VDM1_9BACL|nr:hypothetical protein [Cohnella nanjingensis]MBB6669368.1 hypothetical protein [Cohnella nanjingensis]
MKISDEAKVILTSALAENDCDCLRVISEAYCCGPELSFELNKRQAHDTATTINGIVVVMDAQTTSKAENITITTNDVGELVMEDAGPSCCS